MKTLKLILTLGFGAGTLCSFFLPAEWADDLWFNIFRLAIMLIFIGFPFSPAVFSY